MADAVFLDPDFRKDPPRNDDGTFKPHCVRCQKEIHDPGKAVRVRVDWDTWLVSEDSEGPELMGVDCWKKVIGSAKRTKDNGK